MITLTVYVAFTLYMLMILLRWFGPFISFDVSEGWLRFIPRLTDPLIGKLRQVLPPLGPFDPGPVAALISVWILREFALAIVGGRGGV